MTLLGPRSKPQIRFCKCKLLRKWRFRDKRKLEEGRNVKLEGATPLTVEPPHGSHWRRLGPILERRWRTWGFRGQAMAYDYVTVR